MIATIVVTAVRENGRPFKSPFTGKTITGSLETSTDVPAEALGEICAEVMQKAWQTGIDGKKIVLKVSFQ